MKGAKWSKVKTQAHIGKGEKKPIGKTKKLGAPLAKRA
jgi:hypothetical protein